MKKQPKIKDLFDSALSQSLAKENFLFLHHQSIAHMMAHLEGGNHEKAIEWAKIFQETVSVEKLLQISSDFYYWGESLGIKKPIEGLQLHLDAIFSFLQRSCSSLMHSSGKISLIPLLSFTVSLNSKSRKKSFSNRSRKVS